MNTVAPPTAALLTMALLTTALLAMALLTAAVLPMAGALLSALLMLRLAQRGTGLHARGGAAIPDVVRAMEVLRQLVANDVAQDAASPKLVAHEAKPNATAELPLPNARAELLLLGGIREVQPLLLSPHHAVCMPAAALLLTLCTEQPSAEDALDALSVEPFFRVAAAALKLSSAAATSGDDGLAARLCVLLQLVSQRAGTYALFGVGDLRGTLSELQHAAPSDFVQANVRSILHNIEAKG